MASTQHEDYRADQGWEGVNEREMFARQEYEKYEQERHAEIQRQINMGMVSGALRRNRSIYSEWSAPPRQINIW